MATSGPVYDLEEAAQLMLTSAETLAAYVRAGELPAAKIGKKNLVLHEDLTAFLRTMVDSSTAERRRKSVPRSLPAVIPPPRSRRKPLPPLPGVRG